MYHLPNSPFASSEEDMPRPQRQVLVCLNARPPGNVKGSCAEKGSEVIFDALRKAVKDQGLDRQVMVTRTGCLKHCSRGVTVAVQPDNTWYSGVGIEDVTEICESHLVNGSPVTRLLMPDIPWE
jgi:(2Fe-2S) ferredoxin